MKYLRKYNENVNSFDVDFAIAKIQEHFPFEKVKEMLDKEVLEWTPENGDYSHFSNGEAESAIINYLIDWYSDKYPSSYSEENQDILMSAIQKCYNFLNY